MRRMIWRDSEGMTHDTELCNCSPPEEMKVDDKPLTFKGAPIVWDDPEERDEILRVGSGWVYRKVEKPLADRRDPGLSSAEWHALDLRRPSSSWPSWLREQRSAGRRGVVLSLRLHLLPRLLRCLVLRLLRWSR